MENNPNSSDLDSKEVVISTKPTNSRKRGGMSVEEGRRRDAELLEEIKKKRQQAKMANLKRNTLLMLLFYNIVGYLVFNYYQNRSLHTRVYNAGIGITVVAAAMMYSTMIAGMGRIAVPGAMVVADSNLGVMDDMHNAKQRAYSTISGPIQGIIYGVIIIFVSYLF